MPLYSMISTENFSPQTISTVRMNNRHRACLKTVENFHQIYAYAKLDGHPYIRGVNRKLHRKWNGFGHIEFIFVPPNVGTIKCENWQKICPDSYKYMHANEHMQNHTHTYSRTCEHTLLLWYWIRLHAQHAKNIVSIDNCPRTHIRVFA